jgi:hypothetical protein
MQYKNRCTSWPFVALPVFCAASVVIRQELLAGAQLAFLTPQPVIMNAPCQHLAALDLHHLKHDTKHVCPECVAMGDTWVHLRICQECGHVGCCDDSKNKHATKHFRATQHPVITSAQPGERWAWCYPDEAFMEY